MLNIFILSFIGSVIPISFGHYLNKFLFKNIEVSYIEKGIYGFFPIGLTALLVNFFLPLNTSLNNIFFIPTFFFIYELFKEKKNIYKFLTINFTIAILAVILISYDNVYRPDAGWYHLPYTKILNDFKIIIGVSSLHPMFGVTSILQYISAAYNNSIFSEVGVTIPLCLIAIYFYIFFIHELFKKNKFILKFLSFFSLVYMFIEMNRYSEYGNDIPGFLYFIFVIFLFFRNNFSTLNKEEIEKIFIYSAFTFSIKTFLIFIFLIPSFIIFKKIKKNFFIPYLTIIYLSFWFLKNILISGCLIYPLNISCFKNLSWYSSDSKFQISALNSSQFTELFIKGWYNNNLKINSIADEKYSNNLEQKEYFLKNFNWLNNFWIKNNFKNIIKRFDYFLILIVIFLFLKRLTQKKQSKIKINFLNDEKFKLIFFLSLIGMLSFIFKFPDGRYGAIYIFILLFSIFINFFKKEDFSYSFYKLNITSILLILLSISFFIKNGNRIYNNIGSQFSAWPNIYDLENKNHNKINFDYITKNGLKIYHSTSDNLKIVHKKLCAYNYAPCTPTKNYLNQFRVKNNKNGYLILELNK